MSYFCWKLFAVSDGYFQDIMLYLKRKLTDLVLVESKVNYLKEGKLSQTTDLVIKTP